jgi:hypothetical protein
MANIIKGRGQLRVLPSAQGEFEVDYEIHFRNTSRARAVGGIPAPPRMTITDATTIRATDGRPIPQGQYVLMDGQREVLRLAKDFGKWYGLND